MTEEPTRSESSSDDETPGIVRIEQENAIVQCVFGSVLPKLPYEDHALTVVAELPYGQGKQVVLEGRARSFLDLANWAGVEGILAKDSALLTAHRKIHERLREQGVRVMVEPPPLHELPEGTGDPGMILWGPEAVRLVRMREPFASRFLGKSRRLPLSVVLEEIERGGVLFYYGRMVYVLKTVEVGHIELSFYRPEAKRAIVIAVDLDETESERLSQWALYAKLSKPELIRVLVRGLPKTTRGGRIAVASGVFKDVPIEERRRIDRLVHKWEKLARTESAQRQAAAQREARRVKYFIRAVAELGRGRVEQAVARLEAAVKDD